MPRVSKFFATCKEAANIWYETDADFMAATVSYYAIFAITPLLLLTLTLSGLVYGRDHVAQTFSEWGTVLGTDLVALLATAVVNLESVSESFAIPLFGAIFFSGMTVVMFNSFTSGLHTLWKIPHQGIRGWFKKSMRSALFIIALEAYLLVTIGTFRLVDTISFSFGSFLAGTIGIVGISILTITLFYLMFWLLPWQRPSAKARLLGATVAGVLFTIAKFAVASYVTITPVPGLFGAAGLLIVLLIWVYVSVAIIYYGAAITHVTEKHSHAHS